MSIEVKTKSGRVLILPTLKEDLDITQAALSDPDAIPFTDAQWEEVKPALQREKPLIHPNPSQGKVKNIS